MPLGTHGAVRCYNTGAGSWRARTLFRDYDGKTRDVERSGRTKAAAERRLAEALRDRIYVGGANELRPDSRVSDVAEAWYAEAQRQGKAAGTLQQYRYHLDRTVLPGLGLLRVRELTVATVARFLRTVEAKHGAATARTSRSVLSGICGHAARLDLLDRNPVRDAGTISTKPKHPPRALTADQARDLRVWLTYDDKAIARDLPEFVAFMLATGLRVGEAAAVHWRHVDRDAGTIAVAGNVVRLKGQGLVIQEDESSKLNPRVLVLPAWCIDMLEKRARQFKFGAAYLNCPIFPAPLGGLRDPSNTNADLREAFAFAGYPWLTSHTLRKTAATLLDEAGITARKIADQLGHRNPSMTSDKYMGRGVHDTGAARVLAALAV